MGLWTPRGSNDFTWQTSNIAGTRPAAALGVTVTPGNNAKGSYAEVLTSSDVAYDVYGMMINFNSGSASGAARDTIVDIGVDPAGGTSYSVLVPDLLASCAADVSISYGINYYFPIRVKAGSSIAARASVNNGTVGTLKTYITIFGKPRDPAAVWAGTKVTAYGIDSANSCGTAITSGTTSEGSWTSIASTSSDHRWFQMGMGVNNSSMTISNIYACDIAYGDASNKHIIIQDQYWCIPTSAETLATSIPLEGGERFVKSGTSLYYRMQCSGTADSGLSGAIYGVT